MAEKSTLKLVFGSRNKKLVVGRKISPDELSKKVAQKFDPLTSQPFKILVVPVDFPSDKLAEKAAQKFDISQPFILESYDEAFNDWIEVDPDDDDFELPTTGIARILVKEEPNSGSGKATGTSPAPGTQSLRNEHSTASPVTPTVTTEQAAKPKENFPLCSSAPGVKPAGLSTSDTPQEAQAAAVATEKIWKGRQQLNVYFMNSDDIDEWGWKCRGEPMNKNTILAWARVWNFVKYPEIPIFESNDRADKADIRVLFSDSGANWSMVGMEAMKVTDLKKPTMMLNLGGHAPDLQESLVVHEFGHALGLDHEHQRSDFWKVLEEQLDVQQMKMDAFVNPAQTPEAGEKAFKDSWYTISREESSLSKYDPESIMHYRFNIKWIKDMTLQTYENIDKSTLEAKTKEYLKGLHKRTKKEQLTKRPSMDDYQVLVEAYGSHDHFEQSKQELQDQVLNAPDRTRQRESGKIVLKTTDPVQYKAIRNAVWHASAVWRRLGVELELTAGDLDAIGENRSSVQDRLEEVLKMWMRSKRATVYDLMDALRAAPVGRADLANGISEHEGAEDGYKYGFAPK